MARKPAASITFPQLTYQELQARAKSSSLVALELLNANLDAVNRIIDREFTAARGCRRCLGRGWIVTWDTLDVMDGSCAEYGPCPEAGCTPETRSASGMLPSSHLAKYDRWVHMVRSLSDRERPVTPQVTHHPAWTLLCKPFQEAHDEAVFDMTALAAMGHPQKGARVITIRGRKHGLPIGSVRRVAHITLGGGFLLKEEETWRDRGANGVWANLEHLWTMVEPPALLARHGNSITRHLVSSDMERLRLHC